MSMKKKQTSKQIPISLRRCVSNELLSMEIIPEFSPEPYFVRKQLQEGRIQRGSSLTSRKNKLIDNKRTEGSREKYPIIERINIKDSQIQDTKDRKYNFVSKSQRYPLQLSYSQLQTSTTNFQATQNLSDKNLSDKVSSSCKSVKFSNRLDDSKNMNSKREGSRTPSILKNRNRKYGAGSGLSSIPSERSFSINNSFHSNHKEIKKKIVEQSNTNIILKKKYESILKNLQLKQKKNKPPLPGRKYLKVEAVSKEKYQDQIFPPISSSIFPYNPKADKADAKRGKQIQWKRISQVFSNKKLVIFDRPEQLPKYFDSSREDSKVAKVTITRQKNSYAAEYIVTAMNSIKNNDELLSKIFESQQINDYGVYLLKIFQENMWKYIIIDDFIPVIKSNLQNTENLYIPAFINVKSQFASQDKKVKKQINDECFPIWPFLLEKAYANYYGSYEALTYGNTVDIVQQFCGTSCQKISLVEKTDAEQYLEVIDKLLLGLKNGNIVVLAQLKQTLPMIPLYYKAEFCYSMITEQQLFYYDPNEEYRPFRIKFYDLGLICTHLFLFTPTKYLQQSNCTISKPKHKVSANLISKINKEENIIPRDIPTIRKFTLKSTCECTIFIRQKQKRFIYRLGINYIWLRVLLIGKDYDGSYRWIDGQYSNSKSISFSQVLDAGQYFLFFYPEWSKEKYHHEIYTTIFCNQTLENLQRVTFDSKQRMIEEACTDLAQKKGKMNQINKFICAYNYVDKKAAIVVQNINNERLFGEVNVVRSIVGLKCGVQIVPVNDQFYEDLKDTKNEEGAEYLAMKKASIDVKIHKGQSFTVILKMRGGIDPKFFKAFTFGS